MKTEDLQNIIDQFNEKDLKKQATFGIFHYGQNTDESYIKANKEGLELFALKLLKAAKESDSIFANKNKSFIPIDYDENWMNEDSTTIVEHIELIEFKEKKKKEEVLKSTIVDTLLPYGCLLVLLILATAILVGLGTMYKWFF